MLNIHYSCDKKLDEPYQKQFEEATEEEHLSDFIQEFVFRVVQPFPSSDKKVEGKYHKVHPGKDPQGPQDQDRVMTVIPQILHLVKCELFGQFLLLFIVKLKNHPGCPIGVQVVKSDDRNQHLEEDGDITRDDCL
jgi:hypothetical protein